MLAQVVGVVHARLLVAKVHQFDVQALARVPPQPPLVIAEATHDALGSILRFLQPDFQLGELGLTTDGAFTPNPHHNRA